MDVTVKGKREIAWTESEKEAQKAFGEKAALKLRSRLADLAAAPKLGDLPPTLRPHALGGTRKGQFAINVCDGVRIGFVPREPIPKNENGSVDWPQVYKIEIIFIGDYH